MESVINQGDKMFSNSIEDADFHNFKCGLWIHKVTYDEDIYVLYFQNHICHGKEGQANYICEIRKDNLLEDCINLCRINYMTCYCIVRPSNYPGNILEIAEVNNDFNNKLEEEGVAFSKDEMNQLFKLTKDELEQYSKDMENIHFLGFTEYPRMAAILSKSDVVVNSFIKGAPQSIVNKIGDYLASGKPMINTLENPVFCKLVEENGIGLNVEPENREALTSCIENFMNDSELVKKCGERARNLAESRFDRKVSYLVLIKMVEKLMN